MISCDALRIEEPCTYMNNFLQVLRKSSTAQIIGPKNEILCTIDVVQKNGRAYVGGQLLEEHTFFRFEERMPHCSTCMLDARLHGFPDAVCVRFDSVRTWSIGKEWRLQPWFMEFQPFTHVLPTWTTLYRKEAGVYTISQHNVESLIDEVPVHIQGHVTMQRPLRLATKGRRVSMDAYFDTPLNDVALKRIMTDWCELHTYDGWCAICIPDKDICESPFWEWWRSNINDDRVVMLVNRARGLMDGYPWWSEVHEHILWHERDCYVDDVTWTGLHLECPPPATVFRYVVDRLGGKKEVERIFALNEDNMHVFLLEEPFTLTDEAAAVAGTDAGVKQTDTDAMTF